MASSRQAVKVQKTITQLNDLCSVLQEDAIVDANFRLKQWQGVGHARQLMDSILNEVQELATVQNRRTGVFAVSMSAKHMKMLMDTANTPVCRFCTVASSCTSFRMLSISCLASTTPCHCDSLLPQICLSTASAPVHRYTFNACKLARSCSACSQCSASRPGTKSSCMSVQVSSESQLLHCLHYVLLMAALP